jgi:AcrR family transcriptional regulator
MSRGEQTRKKILRTAATLFSQHGFKAVTMKQIAQRLKITEPAVYRHFASKELLCKAVLSSLHDRLDYETVFTQLAQENDVERLLHGLARHIIDYFTQDEEIYRLLLFSALGGHTSARRCYDAICGTYARFLKTQLDRLHDDGLILRKNNEIISRCFIGMVFECALANTLWKGMQGRVYRPQDVLADNIPIYSRGLTR